MDEFSPLRIDQDGDVDENPEDGNFQNTVASHKIIKLKGIIFLKDYFLQKQYLTIMLYQLSPQFIPHRKML